MSDSNLVDGKAKFKKAESDSFYKGVNLVEGFEIGVNGLFYKDPNNENAAPVHICSDLKVTAETIDIDEDNAGYQIEFKNKLGKVKRWVMPSELLGGRGDALHSALMRMGVKGLNTARAKNLFNQYVQFNNSNKIIICTNKTGWSLENSVYVLPDRTISPPDAKQVVYQSEIPANLGYEQKGTLQEWKDNVSAFAVGNSRICLAICAAFAAPLLTLTGEQGGGFHFRGESSQGKTTTLYVAGSVWGSHKRKNSWKGTSNGTEITAFQHNDNLLLLDEMAEMQAKEIGGTVYMLANGLAKKRMNEAFPRTWRTLILSTGEVTLKTAMQAAGMETKAGHEVRLVDIEADSGVYGIFENLITGFDKPKDQADAINENTANFYGVAGIEFIERLISDKESALSAIAAAKKAFIECYLPKDANPQIGRVINRFALVAAAGEAATYWGLTGWEPDTAFKLIGECFKNWMYNQPSISDSIEEQQAIERVKSFIEKFNESAFSRGDNHADHRPKVINKFGYIVSDAEARTELFCFQSGSFAEVIQGLDRKTVIRALTKHGYMKKDKPYFSKKEQRTISPNTYTIKRLDLDYGSAKVYAIYGTILNHGHHDEEQHSQATPA